MSTALDSVNNLLLAGGAPIFKFDNPGDIIKGTIVAANDQQQTDFTTGEPLTYKDGSPRMQIAFTLQTDLRDPQNADDDGQRRIYAKNQMLTAVGEAVRKAKARLEIGGTLAVKLDRIEEPKQRGLNGQKIYVAAYQAPTGGVNDLLGTGTPTGNDLNMQAQPQQQPAGVAPDDLLG